MPATAHATVNPIALLQGASTEEILRVGATSATGDVVLACSFRSKTWS